MSGLTVRSNDVEWPFVSERGTTLTAGPFGPRRLIIGRDPNADITITGPMEPAADGHPDVIFVSRYHVELDYLAGRWFATSIGKYGWELAQGVKRKLQTAPSAVPYPVVDGMRIRLNDNVIATRKKRPTLTLSVDSVYADTQLTPDVARPRSPKAEGELWTLNPKLHEFAVQLIRLHAEMPAGNELETMLDVAHGTLYNRLNALEKYLGVTYDRHETGGRSKAVFVAEALARHPVYGSLPPARS